MLQKEVTKEQVEYMAENILADLDPTATADHNLFNDAFQLYRQGNIYNTSVVNEVITATVFDEKAHIVELDLNFYQMSECTCPAMVLFCRHKLATFFYVYASVAQISKFISAWRYAQQKVQAKQHQKEEMPKRPALKHHVESASLSAWHHFFQQTYERFQIEAQQIGAHHHWLFLQKLVAHYFPTLVNAAPQATFLRQLYKTHAGVWTLVKINENMDSYDITLSNSQYLYLNVDEIVAEIDNAIHSMTRQTMPVAYDSLLFESLDSFDALLEGHEALQYINLLIYRKLWTWLAVRKDWLENHEQKLQRRLNNEIAKANGHATDFEIALCVALMHFAFLQEKHEWAFERAQPLQNGFMHYFFYTIELSYEKKQTKQWLAWLDFATEGLKPFLWLPGQYQAKRDYCDFLLYYYEKYADLTGSSHTYVKALQAMLPYSFYEYNDYLLMQEDYKSWAELQLLVGFRPETVDRDDLRAIEKKDRAYLLPLYHQAVENAIAEKNRKAYKLAVQRLQTLRIHYRQLKKMDRWDVYLAQLTQKYKRLRAFQEELRKGKLLHD